MHSQTEVCRTCKDADPGLEQFIATFDTEVSHHRMMNQQNKCGFGLDGVCCKLCSNGPCRISNARPRGVCGANADTIVMRSFLRSVAAGSGCYIHVVENAAKRLKLRNSIDNPEIADIYEEFLEGPLSGTSEKLLHTKYYTR